MHVFVCARKHVYVLRDNLRCSSSGTVHLFVVIVLLVFERVSLVEQATVPGQ